MTALHLGKFRKFVVKELTVPEHGPDPCYDLRHAIYCYVRYQTTEGDSAWVKRGDVMVRAVDVFEVPPPEVEDALDSLTREGHLYKPGPHRFGVV